MLLNSCRLPAIMPPNWLGDAIMAQPAIRAIAEAMADRPLTLHGRTWLADLLPFLNLGTKAIFSAAYPRAADGVVIFPNSTRAAWQAFRHRTPLRVGFRGQWRRALLTHPLRPNLDMRHEHHRAYFIDLVEQAGIPVRQREVELSVPESERHAGEELLRRNRLDPARTICVAPGAQFGGAKRYPAESYARVLQWLADDGWQVAALGTDAEREIAAQVLTKTKTATWNAAGETTLRQALQLAAAGRLLLCNDSGLMHVAAGMGKPVVAMFGATSMERTAPSGPHVTLLWRPAPCSPCLQRECTVAGHPCMTNIRPEDVRDACRRALAA